MKSLAGVLTVFVLLGAGAPAPGQERNLPDEVLNDMSYFLGDWNVEGVASIGTLKGTWSSQWAPGKECLVIDYRATADGTAFRGTGILGWDDSKEVFRVMLFFTHDVVEMLDYKLSSEKTRPGNYTSHYQGDTIQARSAMTRFGPDRWEFKLVDRTRNGKPDDDRLQVTFTRGK